MKGKTQVFRPRRKSAFVVTDAGGGGVGRLRPFPHPNPEVAGAITPTSRGPCARPEPAPLCRPLAPTPLASLSVTLTAAWEWDPLWRRPRSLPFFVSWSSGEEIGVCRPDYFSKKGRICTYLGSFFYYFFSLTPLASDIHCVAVSYRRHRFLDIFPSQVTSGTQQLDLCVNWLCSGNLAASN